MLHDVESSDCRNGPIGETDGMQVAAKGNPHPSTGDSCCAFGYGLHGDHRTVSEPPDKVDDDTGPRTDLEEKLPRWNLALQNIGYHTVSVIEPKTLLVQSIEEIDTRLRKRSLHAIVRDPYTDLRVEMPRRNPT
jgi:hypothetical protein